MRGEVGAKRRVRDIVKDKPPTASDQPPSLFRDRARDLRQHGTDAEHKLWLRLRNRGLGVKVRRQHPIGNYIVDFVCLEAKLVIELDGGQHDDAANRWEDAERTRFLVRSGYRVVRFWNNEVIKNIDGVLARIVDLL
jgi:very-short-patch-repair endonuclease